MLDLDSEKWSTFDGGYRVPYDASASLRKLEVCETLDETIIQELWNELHHQGDVGVASYAAIPALLRIYQKKGRIDFNLPALAATIENARQSHNNPQLPDWLAEEYFQALREIAHFCVEHIPARDKVFSRSLLLLVCMLAGDLDTFEMLELVEVGVEKEAIEKYLGEV